jgi:hypothetical protein
MRIILILIVLLSFTSLSCDKEKTDIDLKKYFCFKARYVATGCWPVIQLLEHDGRLPLQQYGNFQNALGVGNLPDSFKNGATFYFRVKRIYNQMVVQTFCSSTTNLVEMKSISSNPCSLIID